MKEETSIFDLPDIPNENRAFSILNAQSSIGKLYSIQVPFQITYEVVSGTDNEDYLNVFTLSENGTSFYRESVRQHNDSYMHTAPHFHDYYEMMIVLEGSLAQNIEGNVYNYEAGSVCFLNRSLLHKEQFHQRARLLFIGFSVSYLEQLFDSAAHSRFPAEKEILKSPIYQLYLKDLQNSGEKIYLDFIPTIRQTNPTKRMHDLSQSLMDCLLNPAFGVSHLADGFMCSILSWLSIPENYHCSRVESSMNGDFLLFMHITHLIEESEGRMTRAALSQRLCYSGDYLNRIIKKHTGLTLHEYNMNFTMKKAADLLAETDLSVSEIMQQLSFTNRTYFYHTFENLYGMTPREFRIRNSRS